MFRLFVALLSFVIRAISAICRSRGNLVIENIALRQQAAALKKERPRPELDDTDRAFWVAVRGAWPKWIWESVEGVTDHQRQIQEAVRLLYVSFTRARDIPILPLQAKTKARPWLETLGADWVEPDGGQLRLPNGGTVKLTVGKQHESNWADRNLLIHGSRKDHLQDEIALLSLNLTVPIHIVFRFIRSCLPNGQRGFW